MPAHHTPESTSLEQRAVVLQLLRSDHRQRWSLKQLERELYDIEPEAISDALTYLEAQGVIYRLDEFIGASRCARCFDSLDLISI
jgi:DNA-binding HxlR family transcriptional regulator